MRGGRQVNTEITRLPKGFVDRLTKPFTRFLSIEATGGAVHLLFAVAAFVLSNSPWARLNKNTRETSVDLHPGSFSFANVGLPQSSGEPGNSVTMALFIANPAFSQRLVDSAKPGIFPASVVSAEAGIALLRGVVLPWEACSRGAPVTRGMGFMQTQYKSPVLRWSLRGKARRIT